MFLLAQANENEISRHRAPADEVVVVLIPDDDQVDFDDVRRLIDGWEDGLGGVEVIELPGVGLPHDVIDVQQPGGDIDLVHSILVDLIERPD